MLNWASKYSSCRSKTVSFSFKTASLLLVADSNCNKNSKRRRTLRERELEKWRLSQSDCTAIPTATVFIPALAITGNFRSFPDFSLVHLSFLQSLVIAAEESRNRSVLPRFSGVSCLNLYYFQQFLHLSISQFRCRLVTVMSLFLAFQKNKSC